MFCVDDQIKRVINTRNGELGVRQGSRPMTKGASGKVIVHFWSFKNDGLLLPCESRLEAAHALFMEFDNCIEEYFLQPFQVVVQGTKYTPDAMLIDTDGNVSFRQVKHSRHLEDEAFIEKMGMFEEFFRSQGHSHQIITEKEFQDVVQHQNREYIYKNVINDWNDRALKKAKALVKRCSTLKLSEAYQLMEDNDLPRYYIAILIIKGDLKYQENLILTAHSEVSL